MKEQLSFLFSAVGVFLLLPCVLTFFYIGRRILWFQSKNNIGAVPACFDADADFCWLWNRNEKSPVSDGSHKCENAVGSRTYTG